MIHFGRFQLDPVQGLRTGTGEVRITPKSLSLLCMLASRAGQVVSKEEIFQKVWPGTTVSDSALTSCIQELRGALHDNVREPKFIETVHRRGYRFAASIFHEDKGGLPSPPAAPSLPVDFPFVGREQAIGQMLAAWGLAQRGNRQVLFVSGHPGVGKTTAVSAFLAKVKNSRTKVAWGQCVQHFGAGEPYEPLLDALTRLCRQPGGERVISIIERYGPTWLSQMPSLLSPGQFAALQRTIAGTTRDRMFRELTDTLESITAEDPLILWLEDLHWSDRSTLDWIAAFAQRPEAARLLLIGTFRSPEVAGTEHPLSKLPDELLIRGQCQQISLGGLDQSSVQRYLTVSYPHMDGEEGTMNQFAALLHAHTEGNPLFVVNVLSDLAQRGFLRESQGKWSLEERFSARDMGIPEGVRRVIEVQIDRLAPEERSLLDVASVAGVAFALSTVAGVADVPIAKADAILTNLARRQCFVRGSSSVQGPHGDLTPGFEFLHVLYRDVVYQCLSPQRLTELHLLVGRSREGEYGDNACDISAELAMHFERGRKIERAIRYLEKAATIARRRSAYVESRLHFDRALALAKRLPEGRFKTVTEASLYAGLGGVLMATYGFGAIEAEAAFSRARSLCQDIGEDTQLFLARWGLWLFYWGRSSLDDAKQIADELLLMAGKGTDIGLQLQAQHAAWATAYSRGELQSAMKHTSEGLRLYDASQHAMMACSYGDHDAGVCCLNFRARALTLCGRTIDAIRTAESAIHQARQLGQPLSSAIAYVFAASVHQMRRDHVSTKKNADAAVALAQDQNFRLMLAWARVYEGWADAHLGQCERGLSQIESGIDAVRKMGTDQSLSHLLGMKGDVCLLFNLHEEGLQAVEQGLEVVARTSERYYEPELRRLRGKLQLGRTDGCREAAEHDFNESLTVARAQGAKLFELRAAIGLGAIWSLEGRAAEAIDMVEQASRDIADQLPESDRIDLEAFTKESLKR
jgi:DNA-binding winged helix-turn-helix (wHTH) protein/predicted ATPase